MFAKSVVLADAFLDLPHRVRNLYFVLGMVADDDGFVNAPKSIMRQTGARKADLEALVQNGYLLAFDSGVVAIKHWRVHNYIRKDAYCSTSCAEERAMLELDGEKVYRMSTSCQHSVNILSTQVRTDKERTDQDRIDQVAAARGALSEEDVLQIYNRICTGLRRCKTLTEKRRRLIAQHLAEGMGAADFDRIFARAQKSGFLRGGGSKGWVAGLDWLLDKEHMARVEEGEFDDRDAVPMGAGDLGEAELEAIRELMQEG